MTLTPRVQAKFTIESSDDMSHLTPVQLAHIERDMEVEIMQGIWDLRKKFMTDVVNAHAGDLLNVGTIHQIALEIASVMASNYIGHVKNEMDAIYCFLANIFSDKIVCPMSWTSFDSTEALKSYIGPYWEVDIKIS